MADSPPDEELIQELQDRVIFDTPVLDALQESPSPLRGDMRERALQRVRLRVKQRRTPDRLGIRASNLLAGPITEALDEEIRFVVEDRVEQFFEQRLEE